ncbi:MAG: amidohydrolase [Candidatus Eisenbacteria bacterium]|nr:amidohydrolase [Candidatus Eisenbacteria bacterium]
MKPFEDAVALRRSLHRAAELSGVEERTAAIIRERLEPLEPGALVGGIGGHGVAAVFEGSGKGRRILVRCELDALPIPEGEGPDASETPGVSHLCGHDGHMAILMALGELLSESPPASGSVVLLFQPAEETGAGARRVLDDPAFRKLDPDVALALHNVPGVPLGSVILRDGVFASTARSLRVVLEGRTAHAAEPDRGLSPAGALAEILAAWPSVPQSVTSIDEAALVTVVHARLGEPALGTTPGVATAIATLRAQSDEVMQRLSGRCQELAHGLAAAHGLSADSEWLEEFPCTVNDPGVNAALERAAADLGLEVRKPERPFAWTEDFGHFTESVGGALFGLGAGEKTAPLHHPDYVFPDDLIPLGAKLLRSAIKHLESGE